MEGTSPPQWTRETTWRQGHVLRAETATALGLIHPVESARTCVVVIAHDCDLANEDLTAEPDVEVIVGRVAEPPDGNYRWGKAPRTLHLDMMRNGASLAIELVATAKQLVAKTALAAHTHDSSFALEPRSLNVLRAWLSVRYNRAAFPDPFVTRMRARKLDAKLMQTLDPFNDTVSAVFFVVDEGKELTREDGNPYRLSIVLTFAPGDDPEASADKAEQASEEVERLFADRCFDKKSEKWAGVQLIGCVPISEDDLSVSKAKLLMQWRLEHMSLRADNAPPAPLAP
ncbi:hypothetical protein HLB44_19585 [Aquincola sp. S2]|uniref:Uncharacterized protein n=1 Tax=Pseudaquabacterium terrae TaxID=2732868 RepID=A0ABX2EKW1_9BURK|nr:hypothetical protein [Aquabacterium terrae]NRF69202.1 hypothetical protein [Aquabacterium terrae]